MDNFDVLIQAANKSLNAASKAMGNGKQKLALTQVAIAEQLTLHAARILMCQVQDDN